MNGIETATVASTPRKPQRANGRARYDRLVSAAEALLEREGLEALSIQQIAKEAGVPMASVYHFFPSSAAACVAVAESYLAGFAGTVTRPISGYEALGWRDVIAVLMRRTVEYYRAHPYAQRLILGSDYSWHIRQADLLNNQSMAQDVIGLVRAKFLGAGEAELLEALVVAISLGDAVWALSVARHEVITRQYLEEAILAACSYLAAKFPQSDGDGHS